jgi:hypothetical protein
MSNVEVNAKCKQETRNKKLRTRAQRPETSAQ